MTHPVYVLLTMGGKVHMTVVYLIKQINVNDLFRMHLCLESISVLEVLL